MQIRLPVFGRYGQTWMKTREPDNPHASEYLLTLSSRAGSCFGLGRRVGGGGGGKEGEGEGGRGGGGGGAKFHTESHSKRTLPPRVCNLTMLAYSYKHTGVCVVYLYRCTGNPSMESCLCSTKSLCVGSDTSFAICNSISR